VTGVEADGDVVTVKFTRDNGERIVGVYRLSGWGKGPAAVYQDANRRLANPPTTVLKARPPRPGGLPRS
jgi:hypothetical protein